MKFPQDFIERVREASNLVDIIGQYVQLRRTGGNLQGLCPFHNEKSPSFSVHEDKQVYHCFGCKASGNVYTFVQEYQGLRFPEAVEYLATRASISLPENKYDPAEKKDVKRILFKINALAAQFYHQKLKELPLNHEAQKYLVARGISETLIDTYKLGYAPDNWSELGQFLESQGAPILEAEQLGLMRARAGGKNGHYDMFRNRIIYPIFSTTKQCIGFGGRVLNKEQSPKYLNSIDSPVFHKGQVFYGLDHSIKHIREADEAIVVEGYMDWLALAKVSVNNIVATLGTALTVEHAKLIKKYTNRILLLFDGDGAGRAAAERSLPILLEEGLMVRGLFLPDNLDPDDFVKARGEPALRQLVDGAPDLFDLIVLERWSQAKASPSGKIQLLDEFSPILARIADPRFRRLYANNLANALSVDVRLVEQSVHRASNGTTSTGSIVRPVARSEVGADQPIVAPEGVRIDLSKIPRAELELLNVILMRENHLKTALAADLEGQFQHASTQAVFSRILQLYRQMPNKFDSLSALLVGEVRPVESLTRHLVEPYTSLPSDALVKLLHDCMKRVKVNFLRSRSKELVSGLRVGDPAKSTEKLEQIMNVQKSRRSLSRDT